MPLLQDPKNVIWLSLLLLGTLLRAKGATIDTAYAPEINGVVRRVFVQPDGQALISGYFTAVNGVARPGLARLAANGDLDTTFAPTLGEGAYVSTFGLAPDGSVFVGGYFNVANDSQPARLVRLNANGTVARAYGVSDGPNGAPAAFAFDAQGGTLVGGTFTTFGGQPATYLTRLNANGDVDVSFTAQFQASSAMEAGVTALATQSNGQVVVGGVFNVADAYTKLARLNANGSVDASFSGDHGNLLYAYTLENIGNQVLVAGQAQGAGICRMLNADRSVDSSFAGLNVPFGIVSAAARDNAGRVIVGGQFNNNNAARQNVIRLTAAGEVDPGFNVSCDSAVYSVAAETDGSVLIAGGFTTVNGEARTSLARIATAAPGPKFADIHCNHDDHFCTTLKTEAGASYAIETSTDLKNWTLLQTLVATSTDTAFEQPRNDAAGQRFFRARKVN